MIGNTHAKRPENLYVIHADYVEIVFDNGMVGLIDFEDLPKVREQRWHTIRGGSTTYIRHSTYREGQRPLLTTLHQFLLGRDTQIDHINHNGLDNRRANLRKVTKAQNTYNRRTAGRAKVSSNYKGVTWHSKSEKWRARLRKEGKLYSLGLFFDEHDAAEAYNKAAILHFGEYACLNVIDRSIK